MVNGSKEQGPPDKYDQQLLFDNYVEEREERIVAEDNYDAKRPHTTDTDITEHTFESIPTQRSAETINTGRSSKSSFSAIIPRIDTGRSGSTLRSFEDADDYGYDTGRTKSAYSRTDYGGETYRSRTDYGDETYRSRTDYGDETARSRTDYGDETYRSRTDYGDETARSRTDYGDETYRSRTDYGDETYRSRTDYGGDTARSIPVSTLRSFDDEPAHYPDTSASKVQSKLRSFDEEPASYEENKASVNVDPLPQEDVKSVTNKSVQSTVSSMKSSVNTALVPSLTFDETPEVMKDGYLTLKDVKNVNDFRTYAQRRREEVVQATVGRPDSGGKSTYRDSMSSFSSRSTDYTHGGSSRSRTPRSAYSDTEYSRSDTYSNYSATDYSPRSTYRSKYSDASKDDRIQTATTDTYTRTYTGSTYTRTYTGSTDSRSRGNSDYSMTPRSQLPYGEDFERLPTDRSDFSYHSSTYDEKQETKTSSSNDNDSSKVTVDRSKQYRQIGKPVTVRTLDGGNTNSNPSSANSNSIAARAQRYYNQSSTTASDSDVKLPHITKKY